MYRIIRGIFIFYFGIFNRVKVTGSFNIPQESGIVVCSNHIHWLDPILLGVYIKREIHFMAKAELFRNKLLSILLQSINAFSVKRGTADITAIKTALRVVKDGNALGIFPEGTRSKNGQLLPAQPGVGMIALKTNAPVVPIKIDGKYRVFGRLHIIIGRPINLEAYKGRKLSAEENSAVSQKIMDEIRKLS